MSSPSPSIAHNEDEKPANRRKGIVKKKKKKVIGCKIQDLKGIPASCGTSVTRLPPSPKKMLHKQCSARFFSIIVNKHLIKETMRLGNSKDDHSFTTVIV
ncbi:hypothetical protein PoB_002540000 [Plakobranchus ocellatus]|uniref:Uncharacterized protein n=1 Tax=Plakobranchus ocellatus TaxID=259542 RepID=A0AAV3ZUR1_9GAST|nr:hypothetical protein PoB_002540000 [Plakobranchus ocellatus]